MNWKKLGKALIFPPIPLMILLIPLSVAFLACAVVLTGSESVPAIISYVLSAYTLTVWCFRIPRIIRFIKTAKEKNPLVVRQYLAGEMSMIDFVLDFPYEMEKRYPKMLNEDE